MFFLIELNFFLIENVFLIELILFLLNNKDTNVPPYVRGALAGPFI